MEKHTIARLFWSFLKIGTFTFGGGYAMIPLIRDEVVVRRRWIARERFLDLLTVAQTAPGPISLNTAVFVGYNLRGWRGAAASILGVVLPSFVIILLIALYFTDIRENRAVDAVLKGMRPAVVALIAAPVFGLVKGMGMYRIGLALLAAAAIWQLDLSPVWLIIAGAAGGLLWVLWKRNRGSDGNKPSEP